MMKTFIVALALSFTSFCSAQFVSGDDKLHLGAGFLISSGTYTTVYIITKNKNIITAIKILSIHKCLPFLF